MYRKNIFSVFVFLLTANFAIGQAQDRLHYIDKYKKIAQEEMERTGVPASIKLAQAILESNGGKSVLSRKANNHFGIKCGGSWNDRSFYRVDDEKDKKGNDIESCFRVYKNPESSFIAHSEFLRNNQRYAFLFELDHDDFRKWAHGLKKAGYATNPKYPSMLIKIVEDYSLFQYDDLFAPVDGEMLAGVDEEGYIETVKQDDKKVESVIKAATLNDIRVIYTEADETPEIIAAKTDVSLRRILKYNDSLTEPSQNIPENTIVFLQPKRRAFRGKKKFHKVDDGESIAQVSQRYGIRIDKLLLRNRLANDEEPLVGAIIKIRGKRVAESLRIPTRKVAVAGKGNKSKRKNKKAKESKYATSLSDFEAPPSIAEEREIEKSKKRFGFGKNKEKQSVKDAEDNDNTVLFIKRKSQEERTRTKVQEKETPAYSAPLSSNNYNTQNSSSNAEFKIDPASTVESTKGRGVKSEPTITYNTSPKPAMLGETKVASGAIGSVNEPTSNYPPSNTKVIAPKVSPSVSTSVPPSVSSSAPSVVSTAPTAPQTVQTQYHTVVKGETLYRLSKTYGKTVDYIRQINNLSSNTISIGQKLIVN